MKKVFDKILGYKVFIIMLMAVFTYLTFCFQNVVKIYDLSSWLIFISIILLFYKTDIYNRKYKVDIILLSALFSFLTVYGRIIYNFQTDAVTSSFSELFSFKSLVYIIGFFNIFYILLTIFFPKLCEFKMKDGTQLINKKCVIFIISFLIIFLAWIPYFLTLYPGVLSPDSFSEIKTILNNFSSISDHHPVLHILFISIPFNIGRWLFNDINSAVALVSVTQMIIMASIFSYLIVFLHSRRVNKCILTLIMMFYAFFPMHGYYSVTMWKDIIFSGILVLVTIQTFKISELVSQNVLTFKQLIPFIIISILCVFFRNNAIYMYMFLFIMTMLILKKYLKQFIIAFLIIFGVYFFVKGPIFNYYSVSKSGSAEYIGIPLQQIGRMAYKQVDFTDEELVLLNKLMPVESIAKSYNPKTSDDIKFNSDYNANEFDKNKLKYFKLWLQLVIKHPSIAVEAYATSTLGYWYPGVEYWSVLNYVSENEFNIYSDPKCNNFVSKIIKEFEKKTIPILNIEWSIGLCFWTILVFSIITFRKRGKQYLYPYIPIMGIWITMMVASPVYSEFRYVYGAFTCFPLLLMVPYIKIKDK